MKSSPISFHAAVTPNPNVIKFIADRYIIQPLTASAEFINREETIGFSPLATVLFDKFNFIEGVFISKNFISITKTPREMAWDYLIPEVRDFLWRYMHQGLPVIDRFHEERKIPENVKYEPSPFDDKIKELMRRYVNNPVQGDGGEIIFRNFKDGVVTVLLKGACVNCPARNRTLKTGIESILMKHIPEVKEVIAENGGEEEEKERVEGEWSDSYL